MLCEGFYFGKYGCMGNSGLVGYPSEVNDEEWAFVAPCLALCRDRTLCGLCTTVCGRS
jgi:hypothetical protein